MSRSHTKSNPNRGLKIAAAITGILAFCAVAFALVLVLTNGHPGSLIGLDDASEQLRFDKLQGATETTDANGVVHGRTETGIDYVVYGRGSTTGEPGRVSFAALGDVLATEMNFEILDGYEGKVGDGTYSFAPYYQEVGPVIGSYDISFLNQETPLAGNADGFEYSGYPNFNTPEASAEAFVDAGIDVANFGSNHSWDMGEQGILNTHENLSRYPELMVVGSYLSQEERNTVHMVERNGMTIAFLSYTYGVNGFASLADFPNTYYTCPFEKEKMTFDVQRARQVADAVVVYMHWGTEYTAEPDQTQLDYAQFLADLDVDLVIGSHAHILQPIRYFQSDSGKKVPVVFGLSDFISGWTITNTILSGMFTCDFVSKGGRVSVDNLAWYPMIEYSDGKDTYVRFLKDMTPEDMKANERTEDVEDDAEYIERFIDDLEMEVPVVM